MWLEIISTFEHKENNHKIYLILQIQRENVMDLDCPHTMEVRKNIWRDVFHGNSCFIILNKKYKRIFFLIFISIISSTIYSTSTTSRRRPSSSSATSKWWSFFSSSSYLCLSIMIYFSFTFCHY